MKIKLNGIGFTDKKYLLAGEGMIFGGLMMAAIGALILIKSQEWVIGSTVNHLDYFHEVHDMLKK